MGTYLSAMVVGGAVGAWRADQRPQRLWALALAVVSVLAAVGLTVSGPASSGVVLVAAAGTAVLAVSAWLVPMPWRTRLLSAVMIWATLQLALSATD